MAGTQSLRLTLRPVDPSWPYGDSHMFFVTLANTWSFDELAGLVLGAQLHLVEAADIAGLARVRAVEDA